jgi:cysteinyl-tRNA synthetase
MPMATYWLHNGFIQINKEKMSKSLGNFFTLRDVFKEVDPMVVRYYLLSHHYRAPVEFSLHDVMAVQKSYKRLVRIFDVVCPKLTHEDLKTSSIVEQMLQFLYDDLNTPGMMGVLFDNLDYLQQNRQELCAVKLFLQDVLGLTLRPLPEKEVEITPEIQALLDERDAARKQKDWTKADKLRDMLQELGVDVSDKKLS